MGGKVERTNGWRKDLRLRATDTPCTEFGIKEEAAVGW